MRPLTIGQVAQRVGVGIETIRFYEREGLIADPPRRASGYREYPPEVVDRLISLSELRIWAHRYGIDSIHLEDRFAVFGYTSPSQIQSLARQSDGQVRVVDGKSAYLTLSKEVLKTGKAHKPIRSLLRPQ